MNGKRRTGKNGVCLKYVKRAFFAVLCMTLCLCFALPGLCGEERLIDQLDHRIAAGQQLVLRADGFRFRRLRAVTDNGMKLANRMLTGASLTLTAAKDSSGFSLAKNGTVYADLSQQRSGGSTVTFVNGGRLITETPPFGIAFDETFEIVPFADSWSYNIAWIARRAFAWGMPKETDANTSFSHAGSMRRKAVYDLTGDQAKKMLDIILNILGDFPPCDETKEYLRSAEFGDHVTFTLYRNRENALAAFQLTGNVIYTERDFGFDMYLAGGADGLGFSLTSKAKEGNDSVKDSLWFERQRSGSSVTYTGGEEFSRRFGSDRQSRNISINLTDRQKNGTGSFSGQVRVTETVNGKETTLTVKPEITYADGAGNGTADIVHKIGDAIDVSGDMSFSFRFEDMPPMPETDRMFDSEADVYAELLRSFTRMMLNEPQEDRMLLAHELRTADWLAMEEREVPGAAVTVDDAESFFVR